MYKAPQREQGCEHQRLRQRFHTAQDVLPTYCQLSDDKEPD